MPATDVRTQLVDRRQRIESVMARKSGPALQLEGLLRDIDAALDHLAAGIYGICETCHDPIEPDRLAADPLLRFCLDPGDSLLLYTDGITEAVGRDGSDYGAERLGAVALAHAGDPPAALVSACMADLEEFTGGAHRADDRTRMVIRKI